MKERWIQETKADGTTYYWIIRKSDTDNADHSYTGKSCGGYIPPRYCRNQVASGKPVCA